MTPKEQAQELVDKYNKLFDWLGFDLANECALIAVQEKYYNKMAAPTHIIIPIKSIEQIESDLKILFKDSAGTYINLIDNIKHKGKEVSLNEDDIKEKAEKEFRKYHDEYPFIKADGVRTGYEQALKDLIQ